MNKDLFDKGCLSAGWTDDVQHVVPSQQKKDLEMLLSELEDIKKDFERIMIHKSRVDFLWKNFYGGLATE